MVDFPRIRRQTIRLKGLFKEKAGLPFPEGDPRLTFRRSPYEEVTFDNGRIHVNGMEVRSLFGDGEVDVGLLAGLVGLVHEYRHYVWNRFGTDNKSFNGETQAVLEVGMNKLGAAYETMTGGVKLHFNHGRLWINDIDPKVVLALFLSHPTEERRKYLQSLQTKLALILEGRAGKAHAHGVLEEAKRIFVQISKAMENTPSAHSTPLLAAASHLGSS